jgi:hypothetical protein
VVHEVVLNVAALDVDTGGKALGAGAMLVPLHALKPTKHAVAILYFIKKGPQNQTFM